MTAPRKRRSIVPSGPRFKAGSGPPPQPDPEREFGTLGAPPADPLESYVWALQALGVSLYHVLNDRELSERDRRKEMREITRAMATLEPKARLYDAETRVRGDSVRLEEDQAGPEMTNAEELAEQSYRAEAPRGRPRR